MRDFDLSVIRNKVLNMSDEEKEMFHRDFRASKGWSVEDEQNAINIIRDSGLSEMIRDTVTNLKRLINESRSK